MYNPLEQFEVVALDYFGVFTNILFIAMLIIGVVLLSNSMFDFKLTTVLDVGLNGISTVLSALQKENLGLTRQYFFMIVVYLFQVILIANLTGLIPFAFTITSSFIVTFFLASTMFTLINVIGVYNLQWDMFNLFLPSGTPLWIAPFLVLIELLSYIARVFSLSIRLFANMMSGHALLKILIGFAFAMLVPAITGPLAVLPWGIVDIVLGLELLIAFLQAYVFAVLVTLYISDILFSH